MPISSSTPGRPAPDLGLVTRIADHSRRNFMSPQTNGTAGPDQTTRPVGTRHSQYMVASRQSASLAPLSADVIEQSLRQAPGVEIVKTIKPPPTLGLQALAMAGAAPDGRAFNTAAASLVVAKMAT